MHSLVGSVSTRAPQPTQLAGVALLSVMASHQEWGWELVLGLGTGGWCWKGGLGTDGLWRKGRLGTGRWGCRMRDATKVCRGWVSMRRDMLG